MNIDIRKNFAYSTLFIIVAVLGLSVFAGVAYIYTLCGLAAWGAIGHLVTLDDDMPGEWSNMERSPQVWRHSKLALSIKFLVLLVLIVLVIMFPNLGQYGA